MGLELLGPAERFEPSPDIIDRHFPLRITEKNPMTFYIKRFQFTTDLSQNTEIP